jgi:peptidoglycan-associated lipoprotein
VTRAALALLLAACATAAPVSAPPPAPPVVVDLPEPPPAPPPATHAQLEAVVSVAAAVPPRVEAPTQLTAFFDTDSAELRPAAVDALAELARQITCLDLGCGCRGVPCVRVEGHCDERGSAAYNLALGLRRAEAVRSALVRAGLRQELISVVTYGFQRPLEAGHTEEAWARNRRAEIAR